VVLNQSICGLIVAALLYVAPQASKAFAPPGQQRTTVQISINADADVLITDSLGKRVGIDPATHKFVNEIAGAKTIEREGSSTCVLPYPSSIGPYVVMITGKVAGVTEADVSMIGPGFVVGVRKLRLKKDEVQRVDLWPTGTNVRVEANQDGPTPQLFLTSQSIRTEPSYRFEVASSFLSRGKSIWVELDSSGGWLTLASNDTKKSSFTVYMRRTNPGGTRESYMQQGVSFGQANSYRMDFGKWDGKGEIRFCQAAGSVAPCTLLKNEAGENKIN
jgi:hypothetical protein